MDIKYFYHNFHLSLLHHFGFILCISSTQWSKTSYLHPLLFFEKNEERVKMNLSLCIYKIGKWIIYSNANNSREEPPRISYDVFNSYYLQVNCFILNTKILLGEKVVMDTMEFQLSYFKSSKMMVWKCCMQYPSELGKHSSGHRTGKG